MNNNLHNFSASHSKTNDTHVRCFERFLKKNKLDSALVVTESGDVVDLYSVALLNVHVGFISKIWMLLRCKLSSGFYCMGSQFLKAGNMTSIWTRFCYWLSGGFHFIGTLVQGR